MNKLHKNNEWSKIYTLLGTERFLKVTQQNKIYENTTCGAYYTMYMTQAEIINGNFVPFPLILI